jgi:hypothetical protein
MVAELASAPQHVCKGCARNVGASDFSVDGLAGLCPAAGSPSEIRATICSAATARVRRTSAGGKGRVSLRSVAVRPLPSQMSCHVCRASRRSCFSQRRRRGRPRQPRSWSAPSGGTLILTAWTSQWTFRTTAPDTMRLAARRDSYRAAGLAYIPVDAGSLVSKRDACGRVGRWVRYIWAAAQAQPRARQPAVRHQLGSDRPGVAASRCPSQQLADLSDGPLWPRGVVKASALTCADLAPSAPDTSQCPAHACALSTSLFTARC